MVIQNFNIRDCGPRRSRYYPNAYTRDEIVEYARRKNIPIRDRGVPKTKDRLCNDIQQKINNNARPPANRPANNAPRPAANRPANNNGRPAANRPANNNGRPAANRPANNRPVIKLNSINNFNPDLCGPKRSRRVPNAYTLTNVKSFSLKIGIAPSLVRALNKTQLCSLIKTYRNESNETKVSNNKISNINKFLDLLKADDRFNFLVDMFEKLIIHRTLIQNKYKFGFVDVQRAKGNILNKIGSCHLNTTLRGYAYNKKPKEIRQYLTKLINQLNVYVDLFYQKINSLNSNSEKNELKQKILNQFHVNLGGRPCIDNALDALHESIINPGFTWNGKKENYMIKRWNQQNKAMYKNQVLAPAIMSLYQSLTGENKTNFLNLNSTKRTNFMWNKIKEKELYLGFPHLMGYMKINNFNKTYPIKNITKELLNEYVEYME